VVGTYDGTSVIVDGLSPDTYYVVNVEFANASSFGNPVIEIRPSGWYPSQNAMCTYNIEDMFTIPFRFVFYAMDGGSYTIKVNGEYALPPHLTVYKIQSKSVYNDPAYLMLLSQNNSLTDENNGLRNRLYTSIAIAVILFLSTAYLGLRKRNPEPKSGPRI
jgi:hypothetical protein